MGNAIKSQKKCQKVKKKQKNEPFSMINWRVIRKEGGVKEVRS